MAKNLGRCESCGGNFKYARIRGKRKGYRILSEGRNAQKIQCTHCGHRFTVQK